MNLNKKIIITVIIVIVIVIVIVNEALRLHEGIWAAQQKKVGVVAIQKFEPVPRFGNFRTEPSGCICVGRGFKITRVAPRPRLFKGWITLSTG